EGRENATTEALCFPENKLKCPSRFDHCHVSRSPIDVIRRPADIGPVYGCVSDPRKIGMPLFYWPARVTHLRCRAVDQVEIVKRVHDVASLARQLKSVRIGHRC